MTKKKDASHANRAHSGVGASSAYRWFACIGSVNLCAPIPEPPSSEFALEGTYAHELSEQELVKLFAEYPGTKEYPGKEEEMQPLDPDMAKYVVDYVEFCWSVLEGLEIVDVYIEKRLVLDEELGMFGTGDFVAIVKGRKGYVGIIIDLKYGKGIPVEVDGNKQLAYYATALFKTFPEYNLVGAKCFIYQPRYNHEDGPGRGVTFKRKDLEDWHEKFTAQARLAFEADTEDQSNFVAGEHCRFCKAKMVCKTYVAHMKEQAVIDFEDYSVLPAEDPHSILTDEQMVHIVKHKKDIEAFLKAVEEYVRQQAMKGKALPGTKLVRGRSRRKWIDDQYAVAKELESRGVSVPWRQSLRTITDVEKQIGKGKLDGLTVKTEPPLNVVGVEDKREAVTPAELDFETY